MKKNICLSFPKVKDNKCILKQVSDLEKDFEKGYKGIYEPKNHNQETSRKEIDYWIIPGIAFDKRGYRLGFGFGFYDNLLKDVTRNKIGICYNFQLINQIKYDIWDIKMTEIITDELVLNIG